MGESTTTTNFDKDLLLSDTNNIFIKDFGRQDADNSNIQQFIDVINTQLKPDDNFIINPEIAIKDLKSTYDLYNKIYNKNQKQDTKDYIEFKIKHTKLADINYKRYKKALEILQEQRSIQNKPLLPLDITVITKEVYNNDIMNIVSDVDALKKKWADIITTGKGGITKKKEAITKLISKWYPERVKYLQMLSNVMPGENMSLLEKLKEAAETKNIDTNEKTKEMKRLIYGFYLLLSSDKNSTRVDKQLNNILTNVGLTYKGGADDNNVWKYYSDLKSLEEFLNKQLNNSETDATQSGKSSWFSNMAMRLRKSSKVAPESDGSQITADGITANGTTSDLSQLNSVVNNLVQLTDANLQAINNLEPNDENKQQLAIYLTLQELINTLIGIIQNIVNVKETIEETIGESNEELNTALTSIIQELITQISEKANPVSSSNLEDAVTAVKEAPGFNKLIEGDINKTIGALIETLPETLKAPEIPEPEDVAAEQLKAQQVREAFDEIKKADQTLLDQKIADRIAAAKQKIQEDADKAAAALQTNVEPEITAPVEPPVALQTEAEPVQSEITAPVEPPVALQTEAEPVQSEITAPEEPPAALQTEAVPVQSEITAPEEPPAALQTEAEPVQSEITAPEEPPAALQTEAVPVQSEITAPEEPPAALQTEAEPLPVQYVPKQTLSEQIAQTLALPSAQSAAPNAELGLNNPLFNDDIRLPTPPSPTYDISTIISNVINYFVITKENKTDELSEIIDYVTSNETITPTVKKAVILAFMNANIFESINTGDKQYYLLKSYGKNEFISALRLYQKNKLISSIYETMFNNLIIKGNKDNLFINAFYNDVQFATSDGVDKSGKYTEYTEKLAKILELDLTKLENNKLKWIDIIFPLDKDETNKIPTYFKQFNNNKERLREYLQEPKFLENLKNLFNMIPTLPKVRGGMDLTEQELQKLTDILLMKGGASAQETAKLTPEQMIAIVDKLREQQKLIRVIREDLNILRETYQTYSKSVNADKNFKEDTPEIIQLKDALAKAEAAVKAAPTDDAAAAAERAARSALAEKQEEQAKLNVFSDKEILGINDYLKNNIEKIKKINLDTTGNVIKNINSLIQTITSVTKPLETREIFKANRLLLDFLLEGGEIDTIDKSDTNKLLIKKTITDIQLNKLKITPETPNKEIYKGFIPTINEIKRVFEQDIEYYKNVFQQQATGIEEEAKRQERALEKAKLEEQQRQRAVKGGGKYYQSGGLDKEKRNILNDYLGVQMYGDSSNPPKSSNIFEYLNAFEKILNNRYINKIADSSNPAYASIISGDKSTFNQLYEKYLKNKEPPEGSEENATYNMIQGLEMNNLIPREVLKVTLQDKVVFVFASLFIRLITLSVIEYLIEKSVVKTLVVAVLGYLGLFSIIFIAFVMLVNLDMYRLRIVFNYVNFHANSGNVYGYLILLWSFGLIIYYIMRSINTDSRVKSTNEESRVRLMYRIQIVSLIIWLFLVLMIAIM